MGNLYVRSATEYCERVSSSFYSEPLNTISNIAFFVSAYLIFKLLKKRKVENIEYWILFLLVISIGIGSGLWHSIRNSFTHALDFVPIFIFFLTFLYLMLKKLINSKKESVVLVVGFFILQVIVSYLFPEVLNGSIRHVVNIGVFMSLIYYIHKRTEYFNKDLVLALVLYASGVVFRTVDNSVCDLIPLGTHFLWHIFTASAIYFAVKALIKLVFSTKK